jgi:hypothetical protein
MSRRNQERMSDIALLLYQIIKQNPGIHFRSLGRAARLSSVGQLRHHLDHLRRQGAIVEVKDGRFKRFFLSGEHDPHLRQGLARFARRVPRRIGMLLLARPMNRTELRRSLDCADSTLGYHLNRMVALGDLVRTRGRNCCMYSLADPDFVRELLRHQAPTPAPQETAEAQAEPAGRPALHARPEVPVPGAPAVPPPPRDAHGPGLERPGRGIRSVSDRPATEPEGTAPRPPRAPPAEGDARTRARGRLQIVPRKPPEILAWHGQG